MLCPSLEFKSGLLKHEVCVFVSAYVLYINLHVTLHPRSDMCVYELTLCSHTYN